MRYLLAILTTFMLLIPSAAFAEDVIDHKPFDELLDTYVDKKGSVAYGKLKGNKEDFAKFKAYVAAVEGAEIDKEKHNKRARLAFYINAYNASGGANANAPDGKACRCPKFVHLDIS